MSRISDSIDAVRPYWDAFWSGATPMLCATLPKDPARPVPKPPLGITAETDLDALAADLLRWEEATVFLGGALPFYCVYLFDGYNLVGEFLGGEVRRCGDSTHMVPFVTDLDAAELAFNAAVPVAERLRNVTMHLRERCGDRVLISASALAANLDTLEAVRGSMQLLMDMEDNPQGVHRCLAQIDAAAAQVLEFQSKLYDFDTFGSVCRHGLYSRGRVGVPQCDFGYMIGPERFRDFAMPYLRQEFARLNGVCYHLDGIGNLPNLEMLCGEPNLHVIQWVAGVGHYEEDWTWLYEKVDALGKGQMRRGSVRDFEHWYAKHTSPWQYWIISDSTPDEVAACLHNIRVHNRTISQGKRI